MLSVLLVFFFTAIEFGIAKNRIVKNILVYASSCCYAFFLAQFFIWVPVKIVIRMCGVESILITATLSLAVCSIIAIGFHELIEKRFSVYIMRLMGISK